MRLVTWLYSTVMSLNFWGTILGSFAHSSRSCSCRRSWRCFPAAAAPLLPCQGALHEAGGWEVEATEVWASWWSSWGAGPGPWKFRWALDPFHQGDLSAEQLFPTSWEPQATPNPLSFPMLDSQTCAIRGSGWGQWHTYVRAHWQRNKPSLAQMS